LKLMQRILPEVIHTHDSLSFWLAGLAARAGRLKVPIIAHKRTDHPPGRLARLRYRHLADCVIAISRGAEKALLEAGVPAERIRLIHSSVDCERFAADSGALAAEFRAQAGIPSKSPLVGTIGSLVERKGQRTLLRAAKKILQVVPETHFIICGGGPLEDSLREQAIGLAIADKVILTGEREDVRPLLAGLDVFVLPSLAEGLGVSALEAMAMGKPVVASRVGGLAEVVEEGSTGLLVEPGDAEELAGALIRLLRDDDLRAAMGRSARLRAETVFSRQVMIDRTEELYYSCLTSLQHSQAN
jgi:glycosyltransferase involved in cell wall biosynthesis